MTQEAMPVGSVCNLHCTYCYENPMREAGNMGGSYDVDAMIASLDRANDEFILFGGEPLLVSLPDLEKFFKFGFEKHGKNGVQTNGLIMSAEHIALFKKYNVRVGLSVDGPAELNSPRATLAETEKVLNNLIWLAEEKISVGMIITIHKKNCGNVTFPAFLNWLHSLDALGIQSARLHLLESHHHPEIALSQQQNINVFRTLAQFEMRHLKTLRFDMFAEMLELLKGDSKNASCVWRECDTFTTEAVQGINGDGTRSNCGRANKDGINWLKGADTRNIRQRVLYDTPQSEGGCRDCRFFLCCRGYCPGTAIGADWRNRTEHCETIKALYTHFEQVILDGRGQPVSLHPSRKELERRELERTAQPTHRPHEDWYLINGVQVHMVPVMQ